MLKIADLSFCYEQNNASTPILQELSLEVQKGEWVAVIGQSGSGKTTLLNCISGLTRPSKGNISFENTDILSLKTEKITRFRKENIGYIFQDFKLIPYLSVLENVMIPKIYEEKESILQVASKELISRVGLIDRVKQLPEQLSGGEKQRTAIARALISQPKLLLCDEPTGNLDVHSRNQVIDLLKQLNEDGLAIIMVTHDLETTRFCHKIFALKEGKLVEKEGTRA